MLNDFEKTNFQNITFKIRDMFDNLTIHIKRGATRCMDAKVYAGPVDYADGVSTSLWGSQSVFSSDTGGAIAAERRQKKMHELEKKIVDDKSRNKVMKSKADNAKNTTTRESLEDLKDLAGTKMSRKYLREKRRGALLNTQQDINQISTK